MAIRQGWTMAIALLATVACSGGGAAGGGAAGASAPAAASAMTTLTGVARDAKGGAVVVTEAHGAVYVKGLDEWPADLQGKTVEVTGVLGREKLIPDPVTDDAGAVSAGALGDQTVIDRATWRLAR